MNKSRRWLSLVLALAFIGYPRGAFSATPEQVNDLLAQAKTYIYSLQKEGLWESHPAEPTKEEVKANATKPNAGQWGGETALAVYALLASGESPQDPKLAPAIKWLQTADLKGMYALGLRSQLYTFLPPSKEVRRMAADDVAKYQSAILKVGPAQGLFEYLIDTHKSNRFDHSVSQYGVLGVWACERAGAEVSTEFWNSVEKAWTRDQDPHDGTWAYEKLGNAKYPVSASMVLAGTATLFITQDYLDATVGLNCTGNISNKNIDKSLKWIGDNFERIFTDEGATKSFSPFYAIYGLERVGVASGRKYFNHINWYERGADYLLQNKNPKGGWGAGYYGRLANTCFGMLFLARGKAPVVFNKLQYDVDGKEGNWNERPRDVANLTRWIGKQTEHDLNWQVVDLTASVNDLLGSPVLYISGNKTLKFTTDEENKLRQYCEDGGLILGNPDCASPDFSQSFRKLGLKLFPNYEFRTLPAEHPIFTNQQYPRITWKPVPNVLSLGNGVRELMIITPTSDPARRWQQNEAGRGQSDFELADDIFLYAVDKKNLLEKGKTFAAVKDEKITPDRTIKLARLQYSGNWDPEPGGWRRVAAVLHNTAHIKLDLSTAKLGTGQLGDTVKLATLTGTAPIKLDAASRQELKNFVQHGGTLIIDAAGGSSEFAASVESEMLVIFGADAAAQLKQPLPPTAKVFNLTGNVIKTFGYRAFAKNAVGSVHGPLLTSIAMNNKAGVYYSRVDLSGGIVGQPTDGINGYDPATATAIMTNLVIASGLGENASVLPTKK